MVPLLGYHALLKWVTADRQSPLTACGHQGEVNSGVRSRRAPIPTSDQDTLPYGPQIRFNRCNRENRTLFR